MKPRIFLDTSAIYALANVHDVNHLPVLAYFKSTRVTYLLHELIFVETCSLITKRLDKRLALRTVWDLRRSSRIEIAELTPDLLEAGWQRCLRYADKEWDWIDCISFELMDRRSLREALSLDRHFTQAGFSLLVEQAPQ